MNLAFGGREVTRGFTGLYSDEAAEVEGTALVGKTSVFFSAVLKLQSGEPRFASQHDAVGYPRILSKGDKSHAYSELTLLKAKADRK